MIARRMKIFRFLAFLPALLFACTQAIGQVKGSRATVPLDNVDAPRFEWAVESAYLFDFINSPHHYEIAAEFVTGRVRWGTIDRDNWLRGYNQFYISAMAEPILRGVETYYYGFNFGSRYNFVPPRSRLVPYISGGVGAGAIDSRANIFGAQGQDFTFNILSEVGLTYEMTDHWRLDVGVLYQHLSNAGQTDPNPSLNLIGPQFGVTYSY